MFTEELNRLENEKRSMINLYMQILDTIAITNKKLHNILLNKVFNKLILIDYYLQCSNTDIVNILKNQLNNILQSITDPNEKYITNNYMNIIKDTLEVLNKIKRLKKQFIGA